MSEIALDSDARKSRRFYYVRTIFLAAKGSDCAGGKTTNITKNILYGTCGAFI